MSYITLTKRKRALIAPMAIDHAVGKRANINTVILGLQPIPGDPKDNGVADWLQTKN